MKKIVNQFFKFCFMSIKKATVMNSRVLVIAILFITSCKPIQNLKNQPLPYTGDTDFTSDIPGYDALKKTVFIIADNNRTEIFDMLAPFYLFNTTGEANVYILAKTKSPILVKKDLYVLPQYTFSEMDSLKIQADLIVIPALSIRDEHQDTVLVDWIKKHFLSHTKMLAICDGASTAAATGLYDGKPLTCHASDFAGIKSHFSKPEWVQGVSVTKSGNLFSTAGVSNAVEGSLMIISEMFGTEILQKVSSAIHYPHAGIRLTHQSIAINGSTKFTIAKKIILRKNRKIGLLLQNNINEFELASIIDTYDRSFPASLKAFIVNDNTIRTKYGLTLVYTGDRIFNGFDELHLLSSISVSKEDAPLFKHARLVQYDDLQQLYAIDVCLERISNQYGYKFGTVVKLLMDYN